MLLILCSLDDLDALAFALRCRTVGIDHLLMTGEALSFSAHRSHRLRDGHPVRLNVAGAGGRIIRSEDLTGVLNRLVEPPAAAWRYAAAVERDYATTEMYAFVISALTGLRCPVRNRPTPGCLAGPMPHPIVLYAAARTAGMTCPDLRWTADGPDSGPELSGAALAQAGPSGRVRQVLMLDCHVLTPAVPSAVADACRRLCRAVGAADALVGVDFAVRNDRWVFAGLSPVPGLRGLPEAAFRAVVEVLGSPRAAVA